ncbi:proline dehydrogenase [Lithohypha guttulata]|nr:proline dehydrogenase [Lithohypha guttulata]
MAKRITKSIFKTSSLSCQNKPSTCSILRRQSTYTPAPSHAVSIKPTELSCSPLARLPTSSILRSLFLSIFFTNAALFRPGLAIFGKIANSRSAWLNPDNNPLIRPITRKLIYDQFCAGKNRDEISNTSSMIRDQGFTGIALTYGREVQLDKHNKTHGCQKSQEVEIEEWKNGNLETIDMIGRGDWLALKFTGAGVCITEALREGKPVPAQFMQAMDEICKGIAAKNCRIWVDAEQQVLQKSIDSWTFDLMRRYNIGGQLLIYSTVQAYLKSSRDKVQRQLELAAKEGWRSGIKLVRGAYIANDQRSLIHDTKADTDASYNGIVDDLLRGRNFPIFASQPDLKFDLLLAGHNSKTIRTAAKLANELASAGQLKVIPEFAQLQGMADDIGCELVQMGDDMVKENPNTLFVPRVYKCLTWGSIQECMQYLLRRLVENRGAADRMKEGAVQLRQELRRRLVGF